MICHTCVVANEQKVLHLHIKRKNTFITTGFINSKKAKENFQAHSTSATHCHSSELLLNPKHIGELMSDCSRKEVKPMLLDEDSSNCCFLGRQGFALRWYGDDKSGTFYQLML